MPVYKAEGIVLRRQVIGEADRTITLLTREYGRLRAVARGTRRITSRLAGRVEPFTHARFLLARGRSLDVIAQVDVLRTFPGIRTDLLRGAYAGYVAEVVDRLLPERDHHEEAFAIVLRTLDVLEDASEDAAEMAALWCGLGLASELGYRPEVEACVGCGRALPRAASGPAAAWGFAPDAGGAVCLSCLGGHPDAIRTVPGVLATCGYLLRAAPEHAARLRTPPAQRRDLARLVQAHLEHQLDAKLRSPEVIGRLRAAGTSTSKSRGAGSDAGSTA